RIERTQEGGDGAVVLHASAPAPGDQRSPPGGHARAALQLAQDHLGAVRAGDPAYRNLAGFARGRDAPARLWDSLHCGERGHRSDERRCGVLALAYRSNPMEDVHIAPHRSAGHGPKSAPREEDSGILIDATLKHAAPPLALPAREFMERARTIWQELELPAL